jgi:hypothetical protein
VESVVSTARSYPVALSEEPVTDVAPFECSRFPPSTFGDECAIEGHVTAVGYEDGLAPEDDPWLVLATLIGAIAGMLLSVMFPNGFHSLP